MSPARVTAPLLQGCSAVPAWVVGQGRLRAPSWVCEQRCGGWDAFRCCVQGAALRMSDFSPGWLRASQLGSGGGFHQCCCCSPPSPRLPQPPRPAAATSPVPRETTQTQCRKSLCKEGRQSLTSRASGLQAARGFLCFQAY